MIALADPRLRRGTVVYLTGFFLLLVTLAVPLLWDDRLAAPSLVYPLCVILLMLTVWALWSWRVVTGSLFNPYTLFFLSAALFNGGQAFLEIFGLNRDGLLGGRFSSHILMQTLLIVILGLTAFHWGALVAVTIRRPTPQTRPVLPAWPVRTVGWILLAVSIVPAFVLLRQALDLVLRYGYFEIYVQESGVGFSAAPQILGTFLVPAALFLLAGSERTPRIMLVSLIVILFYVAINLFMGRRAQALPTLAVYAWLWHRTVAPLPRALVVSAGLATLLVIVPLSATVRNIPGEERLAPDFLVESYFSIENPTVAAISEFGGSMATVAHTIELVPSLREFDNGQSYTYALLTLFPNFFWDVHPTIARGTAASWLVWTVAPYTAERGGGLGYSFIAEAYLNFSSVGVLVILLVLGFFYALFSLWADQRSRTARLATIASFLVFFLFFARAESITVFRPLVWYSLLPYVMVLIVSKLFKRRFETQHNVQSSERRYADQ